MSRGKKRIDRNILPDSRYQSKIIAKFINIVMEDGKKEVAEKIVYGALKNVEEKMKQKYQSDVSKGFQELVLYIGPTLQTKVRRIGGTNYQVPIELSEDRRISLGMKILKKVAYNKKGVTMEKALTQEILDAMEDKGEAIKEKTTIQKMALANKAYSHLA